MEIEYDKNGEPKPIEATEEAVKEWIFQEMEFSNDGENWKYQKKIKGLDLDTTYRFFNGDNWFKYCRPIAPQKLEFPRFSTGEEWKEWSKTEEAEDFELKPMFRNYKWQNSNTWSFKVSHSYEIRQKNLPHHKARLSDLVPIVKLEFPRFADSDEWEKWAETEDADNWEIIVRGYPTLKPCDIRFSAFDSFEIVIRQKSIPYNSTKLSDLVPIVEAEPKPQLKSIEELDLSVWEFGWNSKKHWVNSGDYFYSANCWLWNTKSTATEIRQIGHPENRFFLIDCIADDSATGEFVYGPGEQFPPIGIENPYQAFLWCRENGMVICVKERGGNIMINPVIGNYCKLDDYRYFNPTDHPQNLPSWDECKEF